MRASYYFNAELTHNFSAVCRMSQNGRSLHTSTALNAKDHYKLVIVGGGAAGASMSHKFGSRLGKGKVAVVEPGDRHFYQPAWTLVGGGIREFDWTGHPMSKVLDKHCDWIKESAAAFNPDKNQLTTDTGREIEYDYMIMAPGLQLRYDLIKGLPEAFETPGVCSNYHKDYVKKTFPSIQSVKSGNAVFSFPNTPIKCAGAPQKIMYLAEDYFSKHSVRDSVNVIYNTSLPVIFGVKKYADALLKVVKERNIQLNLRHNLVEVKPDSREAVFDLLDENGAAKEQKTFKYEMLHVAPPCSPIEPLRKCEPLTAGTGWLTVNKDTLQHVKFSNIFGMGDCTNAPTAKTAAAVAGQCGVVRKNLHAVMHNQVPKAAYDGYTSCPLITSPSKCILAEFDYSATPLETFPFDQGKERYTMYFLKHTMMPFIYWKFQMNGYWEGPAWARKLLHLGMGK